MTRTSRRPWAALPALGLALTLSIGGWAWLGRSVNVPDAPPGKLQCLSYTPSSEGGSPLDGKPGVGYPIPPGLIEQDVAILHEWTDCLRTYSTMGAQADVVPAAARAGMRVMVGAWLSADPVESGLEVDRAIVLAGDYPDTVSALVIGNEVLLRGDLPPDALVQRLRAVKARLTAAHSSTPVAYAEVVDFWMKHREVADAVDVMLVHVLPYWDDPPGSRAEDHEVRVREAIAQVRSAFPGKAFEIGEAGWPTAGRTRALGVPGRVNAARVVRSLAAEFDALGVPYNVIEAVDQPWKRKFEGTVGGTWGLLDADRRPKFELHGPVSEWPRWREAAAFTATLSLVGFAWAFIRRRSIRAPRWFLLGATTPACGAILIALFDQVQAAAMDVFGWTWGALLLAVAILGGVLLVRAACGDPLPTPAPGGALRLLWARPAWLAWKACLREGLTPPGLLSAYHSAVLLLAALSALLLAIDGRYRDFPTFAFALPAAAFALSWIGDARHRVLDRNLAAAVWAAALLVFGLGGIDSVYDREAWGWALCCAALAAPWLLYTLAELRHITRAAWHAARGRG